MTNSQRLAAVRRCLDRWISTRCDGTDVEIFDSTLIRNGFYVGRSFHMGPFHAVWFMEEDEIKIRDLTGAIIDRFDSVAINRMANLAAPPSAAEATILPISRGLDSSSVEIAARRAA